MVKIIDFGNSRIVGSDDSSGALGTTQWMAQEVIAGNSSYTQKADVFSFGVVLWELVTRKVPWEELQMWEIPVVVGRGERPPIPKDVIPRFSQLIASCWQANPSKRPTCTQISEEITKMGEEFHLCICYDT